MNARLIPADGSAEVPFDKDLILVGRDDDCELRLDHKSVSKQHCILVKTDGLILVRDLGSTNGTRVNGQRVRRAALLPNDQFAVANFKFRVAFGIPTEPPVVPPADSPTNLAKPNVILRNDLPDVIESTPS